MIVRNLCEFASYHVCNRNTKYDTVETFQYFDSLILFYFQNIVPGFLNIPLEGAHVLPPVVHKPLFKNCGKCV